MTALAPSTPSAPAQAIPPGAALLLYDGECGLCATSVQWILEHDLRPRRGPRLRFAPLQGPTAAPILPRQELVPGPNGFDTLILVTDPHRAGERALVRSDAVLSILRYLGGPWRLLGVLGALVPRPLRDAAYKVVANNRLRFGRPDSCRRPRKDERGRFLP